MSKRLEEIARRKQGLIERRARSARDLATACQRAPLAFQFERDKFWALAGTLKTHPLIAAGISSFLVSGLCRKTSQDRRAVLSNSGAWRCRFWAWWRKRRRIFLVIHFNGLDDLNEA